MEKKRVLIIDDNLTAISDLKVELACYECFNIIGQAQTRERAIKLIKMENPDIVFIDVQLEADQITGFDLLKELKALKLLNFKVVFYTAYEKYAIQAIRASAFDYLLKPIDPAQLAIIISRLQFKSIKKTGANMENLIDQLCISQKIPLPTNLGFRFLKEQSIVFIKLEKNSIYKQGQVVVYLVDGETLCLTPGINLKKIKCKIASDSFFEINRQTIINLHYLHEIENGKENYCLICKPYSQIKLKISRIQMLKLRQRFALS